uniref:RNase H type-1 domain-containing protein n=1 Tax=Solanum tuberosum TaxID=4113 RepID=M1A8L9_SOLTU
MQEPSRRSSIFPFKGIIGFMKGTPNVTYTPTELTTIMQGLKIALQHNPTPIEIASDSSEVINMLQNGHLTYCPSISECRS